MRHFSIVHIAPVLSWSFLFVFVGMVVTPDLATAQVQLGAPVAGQSEQPQTTQPASAQPASAQPAPIIHVDNIEHDFGNVWTGDVVNHTFTISNRGNANLEIRNVSVDCGCTSVGGHPMVIEPGQSGQFPFGLKTVGLSGRIAPKKVIITSNDPVTPQLTLRLLGTFKKRIEIVPAVASFGTIIMPEPITQIVTIRNNTNKPMQLNLRPLSSEQFTIKLAETVPGRVFDVIFTTVVPYQPGVLNFAAMLDTNIEEEKTIRVQAVGRVPARLDLFPPAANFIKPARLTLGQDHGSIQFWLNNYGAGLVNVKQVSVDDPDIKATVDCRSPGKTFRIQVDVPLNAVIPPEGRVLTVQTDDPEFPTLLAKIHVPAAQASANRQASAPGAKPPAATRPAAPVVRPAELMVGKPAPQFAIQTFESKSLASDDLKGKITILNFISPTCPACKRQLPDLEKIREGYQSKGVRFVNVVNLNPTRKRLFTQEEATKIFEALGVHFELADDTERTVGSGFRVTHYPTCVVVDQNSTIAAVHIGSGKAPLVSGALEALLAGKPIPAGWQQP